MQKQNKVIVFRSRHSDNYLESYSDRGSLAFEADYCCLEHALKLPFEKYEKDKKTYDALAKVFECEILVVDVTQEVKTLDGLEPKEIDEEDKRDQLGRAVAEVFTKALFGGEE